MIMFTTCSMLRAGRSITGEEGKVQRYKIESPPVDAPEVMSLNEVTSFYRTELQHWRNSKDFNQLVRFLERSTLPLESLEVKSCICTGLGSFTGQEGYSQESRKAAMYQLLVFETMLERLGTLSFFGSIHPK